MTELSPAAQAVLDATERVLWEDNAEYAILGAAIRAAADQAVPVELGWSVFRSADDCRIIRTRLLAIAAELEGQS